jgi:hypothetical protein
LEVQVVGEWLHVFDEALWSGEGERIVHGAVSGRGSDVRGEVTRDVSCGELGADH